MKLLGKIFAGLILLVVLAAGAFYYAANTGANMEEIPNSVSNKAVKDWESLEEKVPHNPQKNLYFGDLHVHTRLSLDAFFTGNERDADEAYQFAKGFPMNVVGNRVQLKQPLDFTGITDHSEFLGEMYTYQNEDAEKHKSFMSRLYLWQRSRVYEDKNVGNYFRRLAGNPLINRNKHTSSFAGYEKVKNNWSKLLEAAEKHYEPGKFTTFAAYEWTQGLIAHNHRNIVFRDMVVPDYPISSYEAKNELALWESLQHFTDQGASVIAIPHNSNLSRGNMFTSTMPDGNPITKEYAALRQQYERLVEVHQNKGNSEVYADFWKNDEFADFENYYEGALTRSSFVRDALKQGLKFENQLGTNPFKYGMIGSTDTHNSTPGSTEEDKGTPGQFGYADATAEIRSKEGWAISPHSPPAKVYTAVNPGGLVAVWAEANTRGAIYDGLASRECYATSGNRNKVRFFGGYGFKDNYKSYDSLVTDGYQYGVPMGSTLPASLSANTPPSFLIWAAKDPEAANLERIQLIKGWYDGKDLQEKIFDVILADNIEGASVNPETGSWDKSKGATELSTIWTDPEFNSDQEAFYYLRVLELPTARWNLWDELKYGVKYPESVAKTIRERAWSSPIWYKPEND